jgi:hypothetical protein
MPEVVEPGRGGSRCWAYGRGGGTWRSNLGGVGRPQAAVESEVKPECPLAAAELRRGDGN